MPLERRAARKEKPTEPQNQSPATGHAKDSTASRPGKGAFARVEFRERPLGGLKREAAQRLAQVTRVLRFRHEHGVPVDTGAALYVLAALLDSVPETVELANGSKLKTQWCGFSTRTVAVAAIRARLVDLPGADADDPTCCSDATIFQAARMLDVERVERQIAARRRNSGQKLVRADTIRDVLKVTAEERIFCKAWLLTTIDETREERIARRRRERTESERERRRAAGAKPRRQAVKPEPGEEGLSRSQLYARRKAAREGRQIRRNDKTGLNVAPAIRRKRRLGHAQSGFEGGAP